MSKKLITACLALVALAAFALPATASATNDPDLTDCKGCALVPVGGKVIGHNVGVLRMTSNGTDPVLPALVECSNALMTGTVKKNDGTTGVEAEITTADFWGTGTKAATHPEPECTGSFGNVSVTAPTSMCLKSTNTMATDEFQVDGGTCAARANLTFSLVSTTVGTCKYERGTPVPGDYTTEATGDAILTVTHQEFGGEAGNSIFCPSKGFLDLSFTLETETGTVTPTSTTNATTDPLYIS